MPLKNEYVSIIMLCGCRVSVVVEGGATVRVENIGERGDLYEVVNEEMEASGDLLIEGLPIKGLD